MMNKSAGHTRAQHKDPVSSAMYDQKNEIKRRYFNTWMIFFKGLNAHNVVIIFAGVAQYFVVNKKYHTNCNILV